MVIVFAVDNYSNPTDGTAMSAHRFAEGLRERGHTVRILSNEVEGPDTFSLRTNNIPVVSYVAKKNNQGFAKFDKKVVTKALEGADVVHCYFPWKTEIQTAKLAKKMGIPVTAAFHVQPENVSYNMGLGKLKFVALLLYRRFRRKFYRHIENIHCPSKFIASELRKHRYDAKLHVISNGAIDKFRPEENPPEKMPLTDPARQINVMMIGRLAPEKRQDLIIKAVANSKYRDRIHLTFAGSGPAKKKLEKLGRKLLTNQPKFEFLSQDELLQKIYDTDLYVHASDAEIEGMSCIEAFSCARVPIIANSKKSATPQFALDDRALFEQGNYKSLTEKLEYWIENPEELKVAEKAYADQAQYYKIDYSLEKFERMCRDAISDKQSAELSLRPEYRSLLKKTRKLPSIKKIFGFFLYFLIALPVLAVTTRIFQGFRVKNKKVFKKLKKSGVITVCNHIHMLDSVMCAIAMFPRKPYIVSMPENFYIPVARHFVDMFAIATPVSVTETKVFFYRLAENLRRWKTVHFFPEGHLEEYSPELRDFKRGAFHLAVYSQMPIVPMKIVYGQRKGLYRLKKKPCLTLVVGDPLMPDLKLNKTAALVDLMERSKQAMEEIQP